MQIGGVEIEVGELDVIQRPGAEGAVMQVVWLFEETDEGDTILSVEESGFSSSDESVVRQVIDSTCGFNQVVVAAKALIEHGVAVNVVNDHA